MIYLSNINTLFISVPKNASTSFSALLKPQADIYSNEHLTLSEIEQRFDIPANASIIAIIRDPFERLLSLYLYRIRQKRYDVLIPSPEDFKKRVIAGNGTLIDHIWQMRLQTEYMPKDRGIWWSYKNINKLANILSTSVLPWENKSTSVPYDLLIHKFYDNEIRDLVSCRYQPDIDLYREINL